MATLPERYAEISEEILSDIFYLKGLSNRGRVTLIRQYTEILCRVLLKINGHFQLGKFDKRFENELPNAILSDEIKSHIKNLVMLGNAATHLDVGLKESIEDSDCESALNSLNFVISYLFINYFNKYKFGSRNEPLSIISLLPPFIRVTILENIYKEDRSNIAVIDKLFLATLKSEGEEAALNWLENEKNYLINLKCVSEEALNIYRKKGYPEEYIDQILNNAPDNMYLLCIDKLDHLKEKYPGLIFPYYTFEEAKSEYIDKIERYRSNCDDDIEELIKLMDFVYVGRNVSK
ncbi:DUF4145 domain-containing protein [Neisseria weaveri]|uniref:DUF4145 domain-containing protein n=1 Tax=Neisseria weaveri TaxID=28091 RepID=UPI000D323B0B|nr:DUF4145 domain-containing protein [Neisseria weaveri]